MKRRQIWTGLVLLTAGSVSSGVLYVDNGPAGRAKTAGAAIGSAAAPFAFISQAAAVAGAGDTVLVRPGEYNEQVVIANSGTAGQKLVFKAEAGPAAQVNGSFLVTGDHVRLEGFRVDGSLPAARAKAAGAAQVQGGAVVTGAHADVIGMTFTNIQTVAVYLGSGSRAAENYIYHCQRGFQATTNCIIENNEVERLYDYKGGEVWNTIEDCDYISGATSNCTVRGNYFHNVLSSEIGTAHVDGFQGSVRTLLFERNTVIDFHQGLMLGGTCSGITVRNNVFVGGTLGGAWGVCLKEDVNIPNTVVVNNVFADLVYYGVGINNSTGGVVKNNIFYNVHYRSYQVLDNGTADGGYNIIFNSGIPTGSGLTNWNLDLFNRNPLFVNAGARDYHLQAGSPAIDAGTDVGVTVDLEGNTRPVNGKYDIGAYEYGSGAPIADSRFSIAEGPATAPLICPNPIKTTDLNGYRLKRKDLLVSDLQGTIVETASLLQPGIYFIKKAYDPTGQKVMVVP